MGKRQVVAGGHEGDQALRALVWGALAVLLQPAPAPAAPPAYCNGQTITTDSGVHQYPNGQRVVDGFGKQYYPNGTRIVNDFGDIRYPNGSRVRNMAGDLLFANGSAVKSSFGDVRYPNGQATRDSGGRCYYETGTEMTPCKRVVSIREGLGGGGGTVSYQLDIVAGTIDLRRVRFRFSSAGVATGVSANLAVGEIDLKSIAAACPSGTPRR